MAAADPQASDRGGEGLRFWVVSPAVTRFALFAAAVAVVVVVMFATGWADDRASSGSSGRVPVTNEAPGGDR